MCSSDLILAGYFYAAIATKGKYSDVQAEKYDRLPTSGSASLKNFKYITKDLPEVALAQASMTFDPKKIELQNVQGKIGKSDFSISGSVFNYLGYVVGKNEVIKGTMNFNSNVLDLNEFMSDTEETTTTDTASYGVIPIPKNIDFLLRSNIKKVYLMNFNITNATGDVIVKDGTANLNGLKFNMLGGAFGVSGTYNTQDVSHPTYDLGLKIENVSIKEASHASSLVQSYAPVAGLMNGKFSTDFKISGELLHDMMPNLTTVNGAGLVKIAQASLKDSKLISGITSLTKLDNTSEVTLKDVLMSASIDNGRLSVKPFDVAFGSYKTTVAGSTGIDGSLDYTLKMDVPAGKLGSQFNSLVSQYTGSKTDPNAPIPVTIGLGGNYANPSPKLVMTEQKQQVKEAVTTAVKEEGTKVIQDVVKGTEAKKIIGTLLGKSDTTKSSTDSTKSVTTPKQVEEAKDAIKNLLRRKKN